jgi:hypothetical protein
MNDAETAPYIEKRLAPTFALLKGDILKIEQLFHQKLDPPKAQAKTKSQLGLRLTDYHNIQTGRVKTMGPDQLQVNPGYAEPYLLYRLGQFADLLEWQPATQSATFKLSQQAGQRAQTLGLNYEQVSRFLVSVIGPYNPLNPSLNLALKGWLGFYNSESVQGEHAVTIQASEALLNDILNIPELAQLMLARTYSTALLKATDFSLLQTRLQAWGVRVYAPGEVAPKPEPEKTSKSGERKGAAKGFKGLELGPQAGPDLNLLSALMSDEGLGLYGTEMFEARTNRKQRKNLPNPLEEMLAEQLLVEAGIEKLRRPNQPDRQAAVVLLSSLGQVAARRMVELLYDPDPRIRYNACIILGNTGDSESLEQLRLVENDLAQTPSGTVAEVARRAMLQIKRRINSM